MYKEVTILKNKYLNIYRIFNIYINNDFIEIGKYTFVKKGKLEEFLFTFKGYDIKNKNDFLYYMDSEPKFTQFCYVIIKKEYYENKNNYIKDANTDVNLLENIIQYFVENKKIELKRNDFNIKRIYQYDFKLEKVNIDNLINFDDEEFNLETLIKNNIENIDLLRLFSKNIYEMNDMERKIFFAIKWVALSYKENFINLKIAEISFAFETLLGEVNEKIYTPSIIYCLSERFALINGNSFEEKMKLKKEFKEFYNLRSKMVHGNIKEDNSLDCDEYYKMIKQTIKNLLLKDKFKDCKTNEDFFSLIDHLKFDN